jgi:hypothetical protein
MPTILWMTSNLPNERFGVKLKVWGKMGRDPGMFSVGVCSKDPS